MGPGPDKVRPCTAVCAAHVGFQHPVSITVLPKEPCLCGTASATCSATMRRTARDLELYC